jgi:surface antigen
MSNIGGPGRQRSGLLLAWNGGAIAPDGRSLLRRRNKSMIERTERGTIKVNRQGQMLIALLGAAILIGLLAAWLSRGEFKGRYAVPSLGDRAAQPAPSPARAIAAPKPIEAQPTHVVRQAPEAPTLMPPTMENDDTNVSPSIDDDRDRMAAAIEKAARKALRRGEPVRWHKAGQRGYVVVSDARDYGERTCRNVSATINSDNGPAQSSSHPWCTTPDGDWAPAE